MIKIHKRKPKLPCWMQTVVEPNLGPTCLAHHFNHLQTDLSKGLPAENFSLSNPNGHARQNITFHAHSWGYLHVFQNNMHSATSCKTTPTREKKHFFRESRTETVTLWDRKPKESTEDTINLSRTDWTAESGQNSIFKTNPVTLK